VTRKQEETLLQDINVQLRKIRLNQDIGLVELIDMLTYGVVKLILVIGNYSRIIDFLTFIINI